MPELNYECEALAEVVDIGISESQKTDETTGQKFDQVVVCIDFRLHYLADQQTGEYKDGGGQWLEPIADQDVRIKGYFNLLKKDGGLNEISFDQLRNAFPEWNPSDLFSLQDDENLRRELVKIKCQKETYKNRDSIRVRWLGHRDSAGPGLRKTDAAGQKSVLAKIGTSLRATFGAQKPTPKPASNAAPKAPKLPAAPKPVGPPPPRLQAESPTVSVEEVTDVNSAYAWFTKVFAKWGQPKILSEWQRLTQAAVDAGQDYESIDWKAFCEDARTKALPF